MSLALLASLETELLNRDQLQKCLLQKLKGYTTFVGGKIQEKCSGRLQGQHGMTCMV